LILLDKLTNIGVYALILALSEIKVNNYWQIGFMPGVTPARNSQK
ncbi:MAG: hypothetical protein ACI9Z9_001745, partial [Litorivivens sp.]